MKEREDEMRECGRSECEVEVNLVKEDRRQKCECKAVGYMNVTKK